MLEQSTSATTTSSTQGRTFDVEHLCRNFSELSPQPMVAVEGKTHIVRYLNAAFSRLAGKERADLIGRPFSEAVPEGVENKCLSLLDRVYCSGEPEILEEQRHGHTPSCYWSYSVWAILGQDECPMGVMIQITDTTEMAVFRQQMVAMNEQLLLGTTRQHELTETAEQANHAKEEFLATLSHELRTPLSVIVGWADLLADADLGPADSQQAVRTIRRNAWVQVQMIDDLLDVTRIMNGKLRMNVRPLDLRTVIIPTIDAMRPSSEAKEIGLQLQLDAAVGQVSGDPDRLQQVARNLLSNAIKFTPPGGNIVVRLVQVESNIEMSVSDTGKGIPAQLLPHVFDRFRQADSSSTREFGGLGLGLSIARQLVELHGGTVRAESDGEGRGTTFTVSLPLLQHDAKSDAGDVQQELLKPSELQCPPELDGLRALVVDDQKDNCDLLQTILESCGARVKTAYSANAALEALAEDTFDVLISDIGMPDEDGYSLINRLRALDKEHGGQIPAAAVTAYVSEKDRTRVLQSGFQLHVPKPVSPSDLVSAVANLAGHRE